MNQLSAEVIRALSSAQVITSVHSVVKELVENSLDARATNIEVKLENYGVDLIEVRDDGCGIGKPDVPNMAVAHYTSKLSTLDDMKGLETYGFRGEALASLAAVSTLSITTRTEEDEVATTYTVDRFGCVTATKPSHLGVGTVVTALDLFKEAPVRRQMYRNPKHCKEDFKNVQDVLMAFGIAHPRVRFILRHNRDLVWQKTHAENLRANLALVLGTEVVSHLALFTDQSFSPMVKVFGYLPKPGADRSLVSRVSTDRFFQLVNRRPVVIKPVVQVIKEMFLEAFPSDISRSVYPVGVVWIELLPEDIDVNLEPNKTTVLFHDIDGVIAVIRSALSHLYQKEEAIQSTEGENQISEPESAAVSDGTSPVSHLPLRSENLPSGSSTNSVAFPRSIAAHHTAMSAPLFSVSSFHSTTSASGAQPITCTMNSPAARATDSTPTPPTFASCTWAGNRNSPSLDSPAVPPSVRDSITVSPDSEVGEDMVDPRILLDVSECGDLDYISGGEGEESQGGPVPGIEEAEILVPPKSQLSPVTDTSDSATRPGGFNWSRGRSVTSSGLVPAEPVIVQKPVPMEEISAKHSKLNNKRAPAIYDLVDRRPVKRRSTEGQEVNGRKAKKMPHQSYTLQSYVIPAVEKVSVDCDLYASKDRYLMLSQVGEDRQKGERLPAPQNGVIGHCRSPDLWLVVVDGSIGCFDARSVQQTVLFERLVETYALPQLVLPRPMILNEKNLGAAGNVAALLELKYEQDVLDGHWYCCDERIVKNGFKIRKSAGDEQSLEATHCYSIASCCSDLRQLAEMIRHSSNQHLCRPPSAQCYLRNEAKRIADQELLEKDTVDSLLKDTLRRSGPGGHPSLYFFYAIK